MLNRQPSSGAELKGSGTVVDSSTQVIMVGAKSKQNSETNSTSVKMTAIAESKAHNSTKSSILQEARN